MRHLITFCLLLVVHGSLTAEQVSANDDLIAGPLDQPVIQIVPQRSAVPANVSTVSNLSSSQRGSSNGQSQNQLRQAVAQEQRQLEQLDRETVKKKAESGERAAQVVLGADYAHEATLLSFAPVAANDALSDAARWYSLAASRGFPGAPSLDQAGVRFYPIRVHRELRR